MWSDTTMETFPRSFRKMYLDLHYLIIKMRDTDNEKKVINDAIVATYKNDDNNKNSRKLY